MIIDYMKHKNRQSIILLLSLLFLGLLLSEMIQPLMEGFKEGAVTQSTTQVPAPTTPSAPVCMNGYNYDTPSQKCIKSGSCDTSAILKPNGKCSKIVDGNERIKDLCDLDQFKASKYNPQFLKNSKIDNTGKCVYKPCPLGSTPNGDVCEFPLTPQIANCPSPTTLKSGTCSYTQPCSVGTTMNGGRCIINCPPVNGKMSTMFMHSKKNEYFCGVQKINGSCPSGTTLYDDKCKIECPMVGNIKTSPIRKYPITNVSERNDPDSYKCSLPQTCPSPLLFVNDHCEIKPPGSNRLCMNNSYGKEATIKVVSGERKNMCQFYA